MIAFQKTRRNKELEKFTNYLDNLIFDNSLEDKILAKLDNKNYIFERDLLINEEKE